MSTFAPTLQAFFTDRLVRQRQVSPHTLAAYRDTFRLLLGYAKLVTGKEPAALDLADLDAALISDFLDHLEHERGNCVRTRNARLAALRSFYRFASYRHPEHAASIQQVLAIPQKRRKTAEVSFLSQGEADALVAAPDTSTWAGRRDHALLLVALQTGLRLSELTGLRCSDVHLGIGAHVSCLGKGRKQRATPLAPTTTRVLCSWLSERRGEPSGPLFPSRRGGHLSPDAVQRLVAKHLATARRTCKSLRPKHVTTHTLRHSCAMGLLQGGVDVAVISMWLGHEKIESTRVYLHADMTTKERALQRTTPLHARPGRYQPPDTLVAFLEAL